MGMHDVWVSIARREAGELKNQQRAGMWSCIVIGGLVLGAMAFFRIELRWMLVIAFVELAYTSWAAVISISARFDVGRSYIEQCCTALVDTVDDIQMRMNR